MSRILRRITFILLLMQFVSCKSREERAMEYNDIVVDMTIRLMGDYPADSLLYMHSLLEKAIELDPENECFCFNMAQNYIRREMFDSAVTIVTEQYNNYKTSYNAPFWLAIYYDTINDTIKAHTLYKDAYRIYNQDNPDTTNIEVLLDKKYIETFIYDKVDLSSLESHKDASRYQIEIESIKGMQQIRTEGSLYDASLKYNIQIYEK